MSPRKKSGTIWSPAQLDDKCNPTTEGPERMLSVTVQATNLELEKEIEALKSENAKLKEKPPYPKFDDLGPSAPEFEKYFEDHVGMIREIQVVLARALSDDPMVMYAQVREAEAKLGTMKSILAWADSYLDVGEHKALGQLHERSGSFTDLDRRTAVAAAVARQRRFRDVARGIMESIETRISLGQSGLRFIERNQG